MAINNLDVRDTFVSWYFDLSSHAILYGVTVWQGSIKNLRVDLVDSQTGFTNTSEIIDLISQYSLQHIEGTGYDQLFYDNNPEITAVFNSLEKPFYMSRGKAIPIRTGLLSEQILKYGVMLNHKFFYVPDSFLIQSDLIFDDMALTNLIDPIQSDEQTRFPLTESLLIACHWLTELEGRSLNWLRKRPSISNLI